MTSNQFQAPKPQTPTELPHSTVVARRVLGWLFWAIILPIPLFLALMGAWIGSTLAIHHEGPVWLALIGAVTAFAVIPFIWEKWRDPNQVGGRIRDTILRSSFLSLVLIVVLVLTHGKTTYTALATRGDWFLAESKTPAAQSIRRFMFSMAERFQGLDAWREEFSYAWAGTTEGVDPTGSAARLGGLLREIAPPGLRKEAPTKTTTPNVAGEPSSETTIATQVAPEPEAVKPPGFIIEGTDHTWPLSPEPHPLVVNMPDEAKVSIKAVGAYLKTSEPDEFMRAKAVHDFVATWVVYDKVGVVDGTYKKGNKQTAPVVFKNRSGVCAGYAALTAAIGKAAGLKTVVVSGEIRWNSDYGLTTPEEVEAGKRNLPVGDARGHAWNAIQANGRWYLLDTTWDSPSAGGELQSDYLFTPPEVALADHRADDERWQLLTEPRPMGEWLRSPNLDPLAFLYGAFPINHTRPVVAYEKTFRLEIANPYHAEILVSLGTETFMTIEQGTQASIDGPRKREKPIYCGSTTRANPAVFECDAPDHRFVARIFLQKWAASNYSYVGQVTVAAP